MQKQITGNSFIFSLNGMNATAAFFGIGLAYIITAFICCLPIPITRVPSRLAALPLALSVLPSCITRGTGRLHYGKHPS